MHETHLHAARLTSVKLDKGAGLCHELFHFHMLVPLPPCVLLSPRCVAESKLPRKSKALRFYLWLMHLATQAGQLFRQEKLKPMDLWPLSSVWPQLLVVLVEGEMVGEEARQHQGLQLEEQQLPSAKAWGMLKERVEKDEPTRKVVQVCTTLEVVLLGRASEESFTWNDCADF